MVNKRGQAAMEFLVTYGWAILMILILIAAISYFGVLNPKKLIPDRCTFSPEIECIAHSVTVTSGDSTLRLRLKNNIGELITVSSIGLSSEGSTGISCLTPPPNPTNWKFTESVDLEFADCNFVTAGFPEGETIKLFISIDFYPVTPGTDYVRSVQGELLTKVS